jgi:hypothetical protein
MPATWSVEYLDRQLSTARVQHRSLFRSAEVWTGLSPTFDSPDGPHKAQFTCVSRLQGNPLQDPIIKLKPLILLSEITLSANL